MNTEIWMSCMSDCIEPTFSLNGTAYLAPLRTTLKTPKTATIRTFEKGTAAHRAIISDERDAVSWIYCAGAKPALFQTHDCLSERSVLLLKLLVLLDLAQPLRSRKLC